MSKQNPPAWAPFPFLAPVTVTKNPSPQTLQNQQLQTVTPATPLESAFTKTAGSHPSSQESFSFLAALFLFSFHSLHQERFATLFPSKGSALFLKIAGCMGFLPLLELTSGRASTFFSITSTMPILQLLSFDGLPSNGGVPSLCLPASLHRYFFTSFSLAPGAENHLPVFWPSRQYRGAGRSCTLKGSQPEVRL